MRTVGDSANGPNHTGTPVRPDACGALGPVMPQGGLPPSRHPTLSRLQPNSPPLPIPQNAVPTPTRGQPKLLNRLREALRSRHYSRLTERAYCHWVKRFIFFHNVRHPAGMAEPEINAFLTHLAIKENVSASTQTQALKRTPLLVPLCSRA